MTQGGNIMARDLERLFDDLWWGHNWLAPRSSRSALGTPSSSGQAWMPDVEIFHRDSELVVRADLPGLAKDDVKIDVMDDRLTIQGERRQEREDRQQDYYRSERSYGSFYRQVVLPPGAMTDQAKASFKDGVLEITMPAPPESARRGRRLEIAEGSSAKK
jgi:HSP20 family protein